MKQLYQSTVTVGNFLQDFFLLAIRLVWGYFFFLSGWEKLSNIEPVIGFFGELGIPFPMLNAYLVGVVESAGGLLLMVGLGSRLIAIPLIITMMVALATAHKAALFGAFQDPQKLIIQGPFNYLMTAIIIFCFGPGKISIDYALCRLFKKGSCS